MQIKGSALSAISLPKSTALSLLKDIALVLSFSVLTGLSANIKVEAGAVPITMQTLVVLLSGLILGSKKGSASQIFYLLMGLAGLPWFSRGGGLAYLLSPTFGYILGFIPAAYLVGLLSEKAKSVRMIILSLLAGEVAIYSAGLLWLMPFVGAENILSAGLYPFIFGEFLKLSLIVSFLLPGRKNQYAQR